jgi:hypothetical protein
MRRIVFWALMLVVLGPPLWADEPPKEKPDTAAKPADQYQALLKEYESAYAEFMKGYRAAKTDEERQKVIEKAYPQPEKFASRFVKLAQDNPKDPAALDALTWVLSRAGQTNQGNQAVDLLLKEHLLSPKLGPVCQSLQYAPAPAADRLLREVLAKNPSHEVQAYACYSLAFRLGRQNRADSKEAEDLFERVVREFGDVKSYRGTLADAAKADLFEIRNLVIGKKAPEIEGEDIDGKKFKLSDYRGKVVVLDFWGNW